MKRNDPISTCRRILKSRLCLGLIGMILLAAGAGCTPGAAIQRHHVGVADVDNPFVRVNIPAETKPVEPPPPPPAEKPKPKEPAPKTLKYIAEDKAEVSRPPAGEKKQDPGPRVHVELAFDNADLYEVLDLTLYDLFGLSYMVDPTLKAMVTFHIAGDFTRDEFINVLNSALQLNSLSIVKGSGNIYKVTPKPNSPGAGGTDVRMGDDSEGNGDATRLIRLRYVAAATAATNVTPFLSKGAVVVPDAVNNSLLITDTQDNLARAAAILGVIDVDYFRDVSWQIFPIKEADLETLAADLDGILKSGGLYTRQGAVEGAFEMFPIKSMNALLVVTRWPSMLTLVQDWIAAMDQAADLDTDVFVYFVENGSAVELSNVLGQIFGASVSSRSSLSQSSSTSRSGALGGTSRSRTSSLGSGTTGGLTGSTTQTGGSTAASLGSALSRSTSSSSRTGARGTLVPQTAAGSGAGRLGGDDLFGLVDVIPDEANNAIVFKASKKDYKLVQSILKKLDIVPRQVLINVMIAEISLSGSVEYGIEWFLNKNVGKLGSQEGDYRVQGALDQSITRPLNTALGSSTGFFFSVYDPVDFLRGLVYALGSDSDVNILSTPNILALDNREAVIEVGNEVPTATSTTQDLTTGTKVTSSVQYRKTGILLTVTPHINSSGLVKMELVQEVSEIGEFVKDLNNYIILTRRADTSLVVEDGQTIVIAGLMKSTNNNSNSGIPFLKDIPILGYLFGGTTQSMSKTELIIMITPHVVKNRTEADNITREFAQKVEMLRSKEIVPPVQTGGSAPNPGS